MPIKFIAQFFKLESISGILLGLLSLTALILMNSPLRHFYLHLVSSSQFVINDALMSFFFLLVGLEIKREMMVGELNTFRRSLLPGVAAIFGMAIPALIYMGFNFGHFRTFRGWAIPTATDIAFTLAILNLLKSRIPLALKVFVTALAIFDDIGAIIIIAVFYAKQMHYVYLALAAGIMIILFIMHYIKISRIGTYLLLGGLLWVCILKSGIHPTLTGVLLALMIPIEVIPRVENKFHYWVAYFVLPLFAFVNMGIPLEKITLSSLLTPVSLGIILGLWLGKFLGIFSSVFFMVKTGIARLPTDCTWRMLLGASFLCGIGFTMSLFIGDLAFSGSILELARAGIVVGSLLSGICGYLILRTQ
ncbi:MAG: Na+/H+ antiporter NhaA [Gammaproteobacteria bacterium]|nr:Na+/H+ antiporter NhaA [Gammaproteobacteria bacterium]